MKLRAENRWTARPKLALAVRLITLLVPIALSFGAAVATQRTFDGWYPDAPWIAGAFVSLVAATGVLLIGERIARRFLPLAMLLKLALLFPDQVPSRLSIALRAASPKRLARKLTSDDDAEAHAAEHVLALVSALSSHDRLTRGHSERVRALAMVLADEMNITGADRDKLEWAALLHDVGKIHVSPDILNKKGKPDDDEWAELRQHPTHGAPLAGELADWMGDWVHAIDQHHERFDGSGYPNGLRGDEISQSARIVAAADAFEVMTAVRSYKSAMTVAEAREELAACQGTHFDPAVVRSFAALSVARLHRALGPASWVLSLPFHSVTARVVHAAGSMAGGAAPSALAGVSAAFVLSLATATVADVVDDRFADRDHTTIIETADAGDAVGASASAAVGPDDDADPTDESASATSSPDPAAARGAAGSAAGTAGSDDDTADAGDGDSASDDDDRGAASASGDTDDDESTDRESTRGDRAGGSDANDAEARDDADESGQDSGAGADGGDDSNGTRGGTSTGSGSALPAVDLGGIDLTELTDDELAAVADLLGIDAGELLAGNLDAVDSLLDDTTDLVPEVVDRAVGTATGLLDDIGVDLPVVDEVENLVGGVTDTVSGVTDTVDDVRQATTTTVNGVTSGVADVVDEVVPVPEVVEVVENVLDDTGLDDVVDALPPLPTVVVVPSEVPVVDDVLDTVGGLLGGSQATPTPAPTATPRPAPTPTASPAAAPTPAPTPTPRPPTPTPTPNAVEEILDGVGSGLGGLLGG